MWRGGLFLSHEYLHRCAVEIPVLTQLVFEEAAVWFLHPLRQVAEEDEGRHGRSLELCHIFDLDVFAFVGGRGICAYHLKHHFVELRCGYLAAAVAVNVDRGFYHLEYTLFGESRAENYREVGERLPILFCADNFESLLAINGL